MEVFFFFSEWPRNFLKVVLLLRKLKSPNRQPLCGREGVCVSKQGEGVGFSEEEGGGVFVVAETGFSQL